MTSGRGGVAGCAPVDAEGSPLWEAGARILGDCVYSERDKASFWIGVCSIALWVVALMPQVISNLCTGKVEGQSVWLWVLWLLGDIFNLVGCFLAHQLPSQIGVALVYFTMTLLLFMQYLYFSIRSSNQKSGDVQEYAALKGAEEEEEDMLAIAIRSPYIVHTPEMHRRRNGKFGLRQGTRRARNPNNPHGNSRIPRNRSRSFHAFFVCGFAFLGVNSFASNSFALGGNGNQSWNGPGRGLLGLQSKFDPDTLGNVLGWLMTVMYFSSRFPQMFKLARSNQIEGVSRMMFFLTFSGNLTYALSVLVRSTEKSYILSKLPWIVDALGTMLQDLVILCLLFFKHGPAQEQKRTLLLADPEDSPTNEIDTLEDESIKMNKIFA